MGKEALRRNDMGVEIIPESKEDWDDWVSAGRTRNWMMQDPLLDWLQRYGRSRGYTPKWQARDYDARLDFDRFIFEKARCFERGILELLKERCEVVQIAESYEDIRSLGKAEATFDMMREGSPIIYQGVLRDARSRTYGSPDFLIRSDMLRDIFPSAMGAKESLVAAPDLEGAWHYVAVETKFVTIRLNARGGEVANWGSAPAHKAQMYIYNRALGQLQGYLPARSFLLGRGWERHQRVDGERARYGGDSALDTLGPVPQDGYVANMIPIAEAVEEAVEWIRRMRRDGSEWELLPAPSAPELYPNMSNADSGVMMMSGDYDMEAGDDSETAENWSDVKRWLADELKELTLLWNVGPKNRRTAHERGIYRWDDPRLTPEDVNVRGAVNAPILARMLAANRGETSAKILPARIETNAYGWRDSSGLEFFVDFEFCSDLDDDFSLLPDKGGQPLIFMIGCGHMEEGEWRFKSLVVNELSEDEELRIITEWMLHMQETSERLGRGYRLFHWSAAEVAQLDSGNNSARIRHGDDANWDGNLQWVDFYRVMREEPIAIRGALKFGLKPVAKAMRAQGLIQTDWDNSRVDGLGAMVGAWRCDKEAREKGVSMAGLPLMREIAEYNQVDCKAMMEIIRFLRDNH